MRLASRFGRINQIRRDRPLTHEELMQYTPSVFGEDKHASRSDHYSYIPTITLLENLQREGFKPFFACQSRVRDPGRRDYTKHMLRLRRAGQITGQQVPEIIILNSHGGESSFQLLPGIWHQVCANGLVCGQSFGEIRVPHRGDIAEKVIEGAYEVLDVFDRVEEKREAMQSLLLPPSAQQALAKAALTYRFGEEHQPVAATQILTPRRYEDRKDDLWSVFNRIQENLLKGGLSGRTAKGKRTHLRHLDQAFPVLLKQLELMLLSGELNPRHQHCVTLYAKGLVCEADSLGSHGYIYLAIYPGEPSETGGVAR